jgi:predicted ATP-dependent Lon-type protease
MHREIVERVLQDFEALRRPDTDPELEAVRLAILLEDVFDIVLPDAGIDPAVLADFSTVIALVTRLQEAV